MGKENYEKTDVFKITKIIWAVSAAMFQGIIKPFNTGFPKDQIVLTLQMQHKQCRSKSATILCMQHPPSLSLQQTALLLATESASTT